MKIEAWRRRWDPIMAERVPAHITLVFPNEAHDGQVLLDRAEKACRRRPSFSLGLLGVTCPNGRPEELVFVEVHDEEGSFVQLRSELLVPRSRCLRDRHSLPRSVINKLGPLGEAYSYGTDNRRSSADRSQRFGG